MKPKLTLAAGQLSLSGQVEFADAPDLASAFEPLAGQTYRVNLATAQGGAALLLVLLAWQRQAQGMGAELVFCQASEALQRLLKLSDLETILPLQQE